VVAVALLVLLAYAVVRFFQRLIENIRQ